MQDSIRPLADSVMRRDELQVGDLVTRDPGAHGRPEAAHRGPVQRPAPVPVPGGEAAAGEAEDGGAPRADPPGRAQGSALRGDLPPAGGAARGGGAAAGAGPLRPATGRDNTAVSIGDESVVFSYFVSYRLKGAFDKHTPAVN